MLKIFTTIRSDYFLFVFFLLLPGSMSTRVFKDLGTLITITLIIIIETQITQWVFLLNILGKISLIKNAFLNFPNIYILKKQKFLPYIWSRLNNSTAVAHFKRKE